MTNTVTQRWLDAAKAILGIKSDYALAETLGITTQRMSSYRRRGVCMGDDIAVALAQLMKVSAGPILCDLRAGEAPTAVLREAWKSAAASLRENDKMSVPDPSPTLAKVA